MSTETIQALEEMVVGPWTHDAGGTGEDWAPECFSAGLVYIWDTESGNPEDTWEATIGHVVEARGDSPVSALAALLRQSEAVALLRDHLTPKDLPQTGWPFWWSKSGQWHRVTFRADGHPFFARVGVLPGEYQGGWRRAPAPPNWKPEEKG